MWKYLSMLCLLFLSGVSYGQDTIKLSDIEQWRYNYEELKAPGSEKINAIVRKDMAEKLDSEIRGYFGKPIEGRAIVMGVGVIHNKVTITLVLVGPEGRVREFKGNRGSTANRITCYVLDEKDPLLRVLNKGDVVDIKGTMGFAPRKGDDILIGWRLNNVVVTLVK